MDSKAWLNSVDFRHIWLPRPLIHEEFFEFNGNRTTRIWKGFMNPSCELATPEFDIFSDIKMSAHKVKISKVCHETLNQRDPLLANHRPCADINLWITFSICRWGPAPLATMIV